MKDESNNKNRIFKYLISFNIFIWVIIKLTMRSFIWAFAPLIYIIIFILTLILNFKLLKKSRNKIVKVLISTFITIILVVIAVFNVNFNWIIKNYNDIKEINFLLNDNDNVIEIYSEEYFSIHIDILNKKLYEIRNNPSLGISIYGNVEEYNLLSIPLIYQNIPKDMLNKILLASKKINNQHHNVILYYMYKTLNDTGCNEMIFEINGLYYIQNGYGCDEYGERIFQNSQINQNKIFTIYGNKNYENDDKIRKIYEIYFNDLNEDFIINNINWDNNLKEFNHYNYLDSYKCFLNNKISSERFNEYLVNTEQYRDNIIENVKTTEYIINKNNITKIIIYNDNYNYWCEIFFNDLPYSFFIEINHLGDFKNININ